MSQVHQPRVLLHQAGVEFTIYQASARLLRKTLLRSVVGGQIAGQGSESGRISVQALHGIDAEFRSGDRVALLGHNGAGKTTLLRMIAGIYRPTTGQVDIDGRCVPLFDIGLGVDEEANGYENILIRGLLMGLTRPEIDRRIEDIADFSGLGGFLDLPIRTYSAGMMLRLVFSIATSFDPEILLMDEWIATGDEEFMTRAEARLRRLVDRAHILVIASHDLTLLQNLCDRGILLDRGRIKFDGPIKEAAELYQTRSVD